MRWSAWYAQYDAAGAAEEETYQEPLADYEQDGRGFPAEGEQVTTDENRDADVELAQADGIGRRRPDAGSGGSSGNGNGGGRNPPMKRCRRTRSG